MHHLILFYGIRSTRLCEQFGFFGHGSLLDWFHTWVDLLAQLLLHLIVGLNRRYLIRLLLPLRLDGCHVGELLQGRFGGPRRLCWLAAAAVGEREGLVGLRVLAAHPAFIMVVIVNVRTLVGLQALVPVGRRVAALA